MLVPFALALAVTADRVPYRVLWHVVALLSAGAIVMTVSRAALAARVMSVSCSRWYGGLNPGAARPI